MLYIFPNFVICLDISILVNSNFYDILPAETRNSAIILTGKSHSVLPSLIDAHSSLHLESHNGDSFLMSKVLMQKASDEVAKISETQMNDESLDTRPRILASSITKFSMDDEDTSFSSEKGDEKDVQETYDQIEPTRVKINDEIKEKEKLLGVKNELENELQVKILELKSRKLNLSRLSSEINTFNTKKSDMVLKLERSEEEFIKHQKVVQLLPAAEENLNKLMAIVQRSKTKLDDLKQQWQEHKDKLDSEYNKGLFINYIICTLKSVKLKHLDHT